MTTKDFEKGIAELMKDISFNNKKYFFVKKLNNNLFGTCGFGCASHQIRGSIFVNPIIGIYNKAVDDIFCQLMEIKCSRSFQPIINTSIGYLTPENDYKEWMVNDDNINFVNLELIDIIKMHGLPFIETYQDPNRLLRCVEDKKYILSENRDYKLPILYYLNGNKQKGVQYIEECIENSKIPLSDDEINKKTSLGKNIIIRAGENKEDIQGLDELTKELPSGGSIIIVGSGYNGVVSPTYLRYYERFKSL